MAVKIPPELRAAIESMQAYVVRMEGERDSSRSEPLSDERLAEMETDHADCRDAPESCVALELIAEVRRLRRALRLSEMSRGAPAVGVE